MYREAPGTARGFLQIFLNLGKTVIRIYSEQQPHDLGGAGTQKATQFQPNLPVVPASAPPSRRPGLQIYQRPIPYHVSMSALTAAHITHEACEKIGGIGSVLEGFITSPVYQQQVRRTILVGPFTNHIEREPHERLGCAGKLLYSSIDGIDELGLGGKLHPVEWAFNVALTYGRREFELPGSNHHRGEAEILLIDVFNCNQQRVNQFKRRLFEVFGINSIRYETDWGYEEYVRLAEPAFYALLALLQHNELPCLLFSHEFMGLPTAFKATLDGQRQFRTVFHAHECGTARRLVESHPGHDIAFYNILDQAQQRGLYVEDVFGDQSGSFRHALVSRAHVCDAIIAVGEYTSREMHFLGNHFDHHHIDLVYNGVPHLAVDAQSKRRSRGMLLDYAEALLGWRPDVLMTHVTRPVVSKGIWRDLKMCHELDARLAGGASRTVPTGAGDNSPPASAKAALFILTTAGGTRRPQDVAVMEEEYGWPRHHRAGYPDLVGPEIDFNHMVEHFNAAHEHVQIVLVNQFGWSRDLVGHRAAADMTFADLRRGADVELGMAVYEPFGISPLEPLSAGAICVISNVCGCKGFLEEAQNGDNNNPCVIVANFTHLDRQWSIDELLHMDQSQRDVIEQRVAAEVADQLMARLPFTDESRTALLESGQKLVDRLGWDQVLQSKLIPMLKRVMAVKQDEPPTVTAPTMPRQSHEQVAA
jgi:glycosyltransferase involved in cell wall biosynthesis